uniref:Uncharacterized protein n=1 Tax=Minutocellus polymorphus TaxID=265543 RepID=A0A7S0ASI5_9STRA
MVIADNKNEAGAAAADGAYIDTTTDTNLTKSSSSSSTATEVVAQKFKTFVESEFQNTSKEDIEAAIDQVFSPSLVIIAGGEERDLDFFKRTVVKACKAPMTSRINFSETLNDAQFRANWSLYVAGIKLFTVDRLLTIDSAVAGDNFENTKIVRFEPVEGKTDLYTRIKQFFGLAGKDEVGIHVVAEKYRAFVESNTDGRPTASDLESMIDDIFAQSFVIVDDNQERDLDFYKQTCLRAATAGFSANVTKVNIVNSQQFRISYTLVVNGEIKEEVQRSRLLTAKDGKIVRQEPYGDESKEVNARIRACLQVE